MKIQFPIQLVITQTIHRSQGLIFECLTFDLINVTKPGLTYIPLLRVHSKEDFKLLFSLLNFFFQVDHFVQKEMFQLRTNAQYKLTIVSLKSYYSKKLIVQSLNTCFLTLYFEDVAYPNMLASHILCLNETRIKNVNLN